MAPYKLVVLELITQGLWAEVWLNGAPLVRLPEGEQIRLQQKANPWVIEGPNWVQARIGFARNADGIGARANCEFRAWEVEHGNADAVKDVLFMYEWDRVEQPIDEPGLQVVFEQAITPQQTHGRWSWQDATPYAKGDRPAIEAVVQQVHDALVNKDVGSMNSLFATKHQELARGLDVSAGQLEGDSSQALQTGFAADDWQVAPLDATELRLEPTADGRLVNVASADGGAPIRATVFDELLEIEVTLSHLSDGWTIVR